MGPIWDRQDPGGPHIGPTDELCYLGCCPSGSNSPLKPMLTINWPSEKWIKRQQKAGKMYLKCGLLYVDRSVQVSIIYHIMGGNIGVTIYNVRHVLTNLVDKQHNDTQNEINFTVSYGVSIEYCEYTFATKLDRFNPLNTWASPDVVSR